jgi:hypothetical protein
MLDEVIDDIPEPGAAGARLTPRGWYTSPPTRRTPARVAFETGRIRSGKAIASPLTQPDMGKARSRHVVSRIERCRPTEEISAPTHIMLDSA